MDELKNLTYGELKGLRKALEQKGFTFKAKEKSINTKEFEKSINNIVKKLTSKNKGA